MPHDIGMMTRYGNSTTLLDIDEYFHFHLLEAKLVAICWRYSRARGVLRTTCELAGCVLCAGCEMNN